METWETHALYRRVANLGRKAELTAERVTADLGKDRRALARFVGHLPCRLPPSVDRDDVLQEVAVAILRAFRTYDETRGDLMSHVRRTTRRAVLDWLQAMDPFARRRSDQVKELQRAHDGLQQRLRRAPSEDDLARETGWSVEVVRRVREAVSARDVLSLENVVGVESLPSGDVGPLETVCTRDHRRRLAAAVAVLPERQRSVLELYYDCGLPLEKVATVLGISTATAGRERDAARDALREYLTGKR